jgi:hypothetical protein
VAARSTVGYLVERFLFRMAGPFLDRGDFFFEGGLLLTRFGACRTISSGAIFQEKAKFSACLTLHELEVDTSNAALTAAASRMRLLGPLLTRFADLMPPSSGARALPCPAEPGHLRH